MFSYLKLFTPNPICQIITTCILKMYKEIRVKFFDQGSKRGMRNITQRNSIPRH